MAAPAFRRADFLMALAYATDLATGHSRDFALRSCVLAMRFAEVLELDVETRRTVYHQALLRYVGCNADTHLLASAFGDEIALRQELQFIDMGDKSAIGATILRALTRTFADLPPDQLSKAVEQGMAEAMNVSVPILAGHCEVAQRIAERIGLSAEIRENLGQLYERWDGKGLPNGLAGEAVNFPVRLVTLAQDAVCHAETHGVPAMLEVIGIKKKAELFNSIPEHLRVKHCYKHLLGGKPLPQISQFFISHHHLPAHLSLLPWLALVGTPLLRSRAISYWEPQSFVFRYLAFLSAEEKATLVAAKAG